MRVIFFAYYSTNMTCSDEACWVWCVSKREVREQWVWAPTETLQRVGHQREGSRTVVSNEIGAIIIDHVVNRGPMAEAARLVDPNLKRSTVNSIIQTKGLAKKTGKYGGYILIHSQ